MKLRELFGKQGTITDVQLKYTSDGRFRHFAFIGFSSENEAESARDYFGKTFIGAMKIDVQSCAKLGKSTGLYLQEPSLYHVIH